MFLAALGTGLETGFTGTHTPPMPFVIEFFALPIGLIFVLIDVMRHRPVTLQNMRVHAIGWGSNGVIMLYILVMYFI
jgi:hypothetical protein